MAKYGAGYTGNDLNEYWKYYYGTSYPGGELKRLDTMTDEEVARGKALLKGYNNRNLINEKYGTDVSTVTDKYDALMASNTKGYEKRIADAREEYGKSSDLLSEKYGIKKENATSLYNRNTENLLARYENARAAIEESKKQQEQMAGITYEKLKKYLPQQVKAQGLEGLGVSESTMLEAYNTMMGQMGRIGSEYGQNLTTLEEAYGRDKSAFDTEYEREMSELALAYGDSAAGLERDLARAISGYNAASDSAADTFKAQKAAELADLKSAYDINIYNADKDPMGNYLVENVEKEYQQKQELEETVSRENAYNSVMNTMAALEMSLVDTDEYGRMEITEDNRKKIEKFLDENRVILGEAVYNAEMSKLGAITVKSNAERNALFDEAISKIESNQNPNTKLILLGDALGQLEGIKGSAGYASYKERLMEGTVTDYNEYYVQGLGSGRKNDDVDITIGSTKRDLKTEFDLVIGDAVTNEEAISVLNGMTSGVASEPPQEGYICVVSRDMYIYTKEGWKKVTGDRSDVKAAVDAFLNAAGKGAHAQSKGAHTPSKGGGANR